MHSIYIKYKHFSPCSCAVHTKKCVFKNVVFYGRGAENGEKSKRAQQESRKNTKEQEEKNTFLKTEKNKQKKYVLKNVVELAGRIKKVVLKNGENKPLRLLKKCGSM